MAVFFSNNGNLKAQAICYFWTWEKGVKILTVWKTDNTRFPSCRKCYPCCSFTTVKGEGKINPEKQSFLLPSILQRRV